MTAFLERLNAVPLGDNDFTFEFTQWVTSLVDVLNEIINEIENIVFLEQFVESTPFRVEVNNTYIANLAAPVTFNLPDNMQVGSVVRVVGRGSGGWVLVPGSGQTIKVSASSAGTSIASTSRYDCISIICVEQDTTWVTTNSQTAGFVIT